MKIILRLLFLAILTAFLVNCGNQKVTQQGKGYIYLVIEFGYIEPILALCEDSFIEDDFTTQDEYKQAVANCTLDNLVLIKFDLKGLDDILDTTCDKDLDLSDLSPEDLELVDRVCGILGT